MPQKNQKKGKGGGAGNKNKKAGGGGGNKKPQNKNNNNNNNKNNNNNNNDNQNQEEKMEELKIDNLNIDANMGDIPHGFNIIPKEDYCKNGQTLPPTKLVSELFKDGFPCGQTLPHPVDGKLRMESDERKAKENHILWKQRIEEVREGAEVHRQVRQAAQHYIKPGQTMIEICNFIETLSSKLVGFDLENPFLKGWGFPTGCSLNYCAAHYTPNPGDKLKLKKKDLMKVDFGVHVNGHIIDCAFSMSFDSMHDELMEAVKAATNKGIEVMGVDARLGEIGAEIQEVMESYQCTYDGKIYDVKAIQNLNGHSIAPYIIHGGKTVPIIKTNEQTKMEEGEMYAIETFGSTGNGLVHDDGECSHFGLIPDHPKMMIDHKGARDLLKHIQKRFGTLPFCRRWLEDEGQKRHIMSLKQLVDHEIVRAYPPLCDSPSCYTAQYEHTILLKPTSKEVLSRGLDY